MFGKVKRWLGIEGVKLELDVPEYFSLKSGQVIGRVRFISMSDQDVYELNLKLVEKYKRGRRKSKLIDEYTLGEISMHDRIEVKAGEEAYLPFILPFMPLKSEMDIMSEKNIIVRGVIAAAKMLKGVDSEYRLEARAKVRGTALHPLAVKVLQVEK